MAENSKNENSKFTPLDEDALRQVSGGSVFPEMKPLDPQDPETPVIPSGFSIRKSDNAIKR